MEKDSHKAWILSSTTKEEQSYIEHRILPQIKYYSKASRCSQREYYILSITGVILMATVPIITMLSDTIVYAKYISASISAISSILSSVLLVRGAKDNWVEYRNTSEMLKSELAAFIARSVDYKTRDCTIRFQLFVERCESIMQKERTGWYSRMKTEVDQTNGVKGTSEETGS